ncbi:acyl-ACP--UDP-N-acetylglucosamine O-acyltransferase [uncultured Bacteroides sp.]|uniref:acyl-ACP--UDP-N-acetylglucosamine O-acyltransferase n=1 Tax=uncultured Bacteroides sp. TaxID=162156 RepID=UPI002AA5F3EE|nr:acyl-ACP--UDP-N-acetylglucosamine O-acyltransferase [uncultured Bacteroides sp.]
MISPQAFVDPGAKIGKNVEIYPFAYIEKDVEIGDNCIIMPYVSVMNGTRMGEGNHVFQNTVLGALPQDFNYTGEDSSLIIGKNNMIRENVVINRATHAGQSTTIGDHNCLFEGVHISHDSKIADHCVFGFGTKVAGDCKVDSHAIMGSQAVIQQGAHIASWTMIRGGCRFDKDVPPFIVVSGNPTHYYGINSLMLTKGHFPEKIQKHIANAYRLIYQGNTSIFDAIIRIHEQVPMSEEIEQIIQFVQQSEENTGIIR